MDPVVLFFLLGVIAGVLRSELRLPVQVYELLSILLLLAIGMKGGIELARQPFLELVPQMVAVVAMGFVLPLLSYPVLLSIGRLPRADAASIAAHYGSVSVGTFAVVVAYLGSRSSSASSSPKGSPAGQSCAIQRTKCCSARASSCSWAGC